MAENGEQIAAEIVGKLERAWNAGDGNGWGAQFAEDSDFVTVRGDYFRTRRAIAEGHQAIFNTIYKDSSNQYELLRARPLGDGLILAHARADGRRVSDPLLGGPGAWGERLARHELSQHVPRRRRIHASARAGSLAGPRGRPDAVIGRRDGPRTRSTSRCGTMWKWTSIASTAAPLMRGQQAWHPC